MKTLFIILFTFLNIIAPTKESDYFKEVIHNNYDYYEIIEEEETSIGDIIIVKGAVNKKMYISMFVYQTQANIHKVVINNSITTGEVINIHKVRLDKDIEIKILSKNGEFFKKYLVEKTKYDDFIKVAMEGNGKNHFPKALQEYNIFDTFVSLIYIFIGLTSFLSLVLFIIYKKKVNKASTVSNDNYYINVDYDLLEEEKTEEELMKEAYEDYHNGKITEQELNNRLRNIWWSKKDD